MTTIAYRDGVLAADTRISESIGETLAIHYAKAVKVRRVGPFLIGLVGSLYTWEKFYSWVRGGLNGDHPVDADSEGFLIMPDGLVVCFEAPGPARLITEYAAWGSGRQLALGAMAVGASPEEAVLAAAAHDLYTNSELTVIEL